MKNKINTICFIFLFFVLISAVAAAQDENETVQSIAQPESDDDLCKVTVENIAEDKLYLDENAKKISTDNSAEKLSATQKTVKKKITMSAANVNMYYKDGSKFTVTLKYQKKVIGNVKVQINIDGKTYTRTTDSKGKATLNLNFKSGTYSVVSTCTGNSEFESASAKSTVTIKSTIKASDLSKYYKNTKKYSATFYHKKGKVLKNTAVKFKINSKTYSVKTNSKGVASLAIDLKPNKYSITVSNPKTSESISKTVTVKSYIVTNDLTFKENQKGKFNVKIVNSDGKAQSSKKVTLKVNGKTYTKTTNKNGIATLELSLNKGSYTITTEYSGLKSTNKITVSKIVKKSSFSFITLIPSYVNVTTTQVYDNSVYTLKSGYNGIIKMPKNELFTVEVGDKSYLLSTMPISGVYTTVIGYLNHMIPFDGGNIISDINKDNLKGNGLIISKINGFTQIEYRSSTSDNVELFGFYADKGLGSSETLTYMQNDKIKAKVNVETQSFDEMGLQYSLSKFYQKSIYDFNYKSYDEITNHNSALIKFARTNTPITFTYFGKTIAGDIPEEEIITKLIVNGKEELEKKEIISYGFSDKYRKTVGFEVLQAYSIITEKINKDTLDEWLNYNKLYLDRFGVMNAYGMHLASLETVWMADKIADEFSSEYNVNWKRDKALTILGGINLDDTYLDILNSDMAMTVTGEKENVMMFRLHNSILLPNLEDYALSEIGNRYKDYSVNSLENVFSAIENQKYSICQIGDLLYLFTEDGSDCAIVINNTSGVASVIMAHNDSVYKGSRISTINDCCSICQLARDIMGGVKYITKQTSSVIASLSSQINKIYPTSMMGYIGGKFTLQSLLKGAGNLGLRLISIMTTVQTAGVTYRDNFVDKKDMYTVMDSATFTRPGYLQGKKVYNIPNKNGGYDYVEAKINADLTLDRTTAKYISNGNVKTLTKAETYQYFTDDYWSPFSVPLKYWDKSWE